MIIADDDPYPPSHMAAAEAYRQNEQRAHMQAVQANLLMTMNNFAPFVSTQPVYQKLLVEAHQSLRDGHNEMAFVLSQAAAELCTEAAISTLLTRRDIAELAEPLLKLVTVKDIVGNNRLRAVYVTLADDKIEDEVFWPRLVASRERRHSIVHKGEKCGAKEAVEAVEQFIGHTEFVIKRQSALASIHEELPSTA